MSVERDVVTAETEVTEAMVVAGCAVLAEYDAEADSAEDVVTQILSAMLDCAPLPIVLRFHRWFPVSRLSTREANARRRRRIQQIRASQFF